VLGFVFSVLSGVAGWDGSENTDNSAQLELKKCIISDVSQKISKKKYA
jgi:hypothetical protein